MDKTLHLLQMGFTEEEVSTAIDIYGMLNFFSNTMDVIYFIQGELYRLNLLILVKCYYFNENASISYD